MMTFSNHISIHAPAWGATGGSDSAFLTITDFNPRARVGRDYIKPEYDMEDVISIHAPAWGATKSE